MKYNLLFVLILCLSSCAKDDITTETEMGKGLGSISGRAMLDTNRDGQGDTPPAITLDVYYIDSVLFNSINNIACKDLTLDSSMIIGEIIGETQTDEEGNFEFIGVQPDENNFLFLCNSIEWEQIMGQDTSPDGDDGEEILQFAIPVSIVDNEDDTDNLFLITEEKGSIQGKVEVDLDGDGIADVSVNEANLNAPDGKKLFLLQKNELINQYVLHRFTDVDENGMYSFDNLVEGQYIVRSDFEVEFILFSEDESPDFDGEPSSNETDIDVFIVQDETDSDNNFILQKPSPLPSIVRGTVTQDLNSDGVGDMPLVNYEVEIRAWDGVNTGELLLSAISDADGNYEFQDVPVGDYALTITNGQGLTVSISYDNSGDPISGPGPDPAILLLDMTSGEIDSDNIFVLAQFAKLSVSGFVLNDLDGDGIGDEGLSDHRVVIHLRSESGVPMGSSPVAVDYSNSDGSYMFYNLPADDYVIYHIGTGDYPYICISGEDQSPEIGEPTTNPECFFIAVDHLDEQIDSDNVFTLEKQ